MIDVLVAGQVARNPGMLQGQLAGVALSGVDADQVRYEIFGRLGDVVPIGAVELVVALHYLREQIIIVSVFVVEGRVTAQQNVGYHADRPDVHCFAVADMFRGDCFFDRSFVRGRRRQTQPQRQAKPKGMSYNNELVTIGCGPVSGAARRDETEKETYGVWASTSGATYPGVPQAVDFYPRGLCSHPGGRGVGR